MKGTEPRRRLLRRHLQRRRAAVPSSPRRLASRLRSWAATVSTTPSTSSSPVRRTPRATSAPRSACRSTQLPEGPGLQGRLREDVPGEEIAAYDAYAYDADERHHRRDRSRPPRRCGAAKVTDARGRDAIIATVAATNTEGVTGAISFDANGDTTNKAITLYDGQGRRVGPVVATEPSRLSLPPSVH